MAPPPQQAAVVVPVSVATTTLLLLCLCGDLIPSSRAFSSSSSSSSSVVPRAIPYHRHALHRADAEATPDYMYPRRRNAAAALIAPRRRTRPTATATRFTIPHVNRSPPSTALSTTELNAAVISDDGGEGAATSTSGIEETPESGGSPAGGSIRVGIVGSGAVAFGTAAILRRNGHDPMLWSPSGAGTSDLLASAASSSSSSTNAAGTLTSSGAVAVSFRPRIATSAEELVGSNSVILFALPANGHVAVMDAISPHLRCGAHTAIVSSHSSLGAVYLNERLAERGINVDGTDGCEPMEEEEEQRRGVPIVAWGTTVCTARRTSGSSVRVCTVRSQVDMCAVPSVHTDRGLSVCRALFGDRFRVREGLMAISLSNLNAQNHLGIVLGNMSRMERGEKWSQGLNLTPNVGRLLEALDRERLDIAERLGVQVRTIHEHFHLSFHVPIASVSEMNQAMVEKGNDVDGPDSPDSRYVTEDVPYGLTLIVALGRLVGRPAMLHESGVRIVSAMYGRDFGNENELLNALGLPMDGSGEFGVEELKEAGQTGLLRGRRGGGGVDGN